MLQTAIGYVLRFMFRAKSKYIHLRNVHKHYVILLNAKALTKIHFQ